ncbi:MAG: hypothetical protein CHACPFDD_01666 [Phycisphaerae bacterium]|nr:hypothetical protein [Phycisphaerae bacterium]
MRQKVSLVAVALLGSLLAAGQEVRDADEGRARRREEPLFMGFSQKTIELWVNRMVDDSTERYGFDEEQNERTREIFREALPRYLLEHREEIQELTNQFMQAQFGDEPPTPEFVADWAQRALPLLDKFKDVVHESTDKMREFMTDDQQIQLDAEWAAFDTGFSMARNKVGEWSEGGFDPADWAPNERERRKREREENRIAQQEMDKARSEVLQESGVAKRDGAEAQVVVAANQPKNGKPAAKAAEPADEWTRYVEDFIRMYDLDSAQQNSARKSLRKYRELRDQFLRKSSTVAAMDRLDKKRKAAQNDEERTAVDKEITELTSRVDRYFQQLKDDLEKLPTREQRSRKAERPKQG